MNRSRRRGPIIRPDVPRPPGQRPEGSPHIPLPAGHPLRRHPLLAPALEAVAGACRIARAIQRDLARVRQITKDDRSPVTVADFAVQAVVHLALADAEGRAVVVGEESARLLRDPAHRGVREAVLEAIRTCRPAITSTEALAAIDACDRDASATAYWTLDPIDGTKGFLRGQQYAIALARIEAGRVVLGVMGCPNLAPGADHPLDAPDGTGTLFAALRDGGAWQVSTSPGGEPAPIRAAASIAGAGGIRVCESVEAAHSQHDRTRRVLAALGQPGTLLRLDSQCKYALVARGQADAYLRLPTTSTYVEKVWDHAAGAIIASEAGAIVTDIDGLPLDFGCGRTLAGNRGLLCATRSVHPAVLEAIAQLGIAGGRRAHSRAAAPAAPAPPPHRGP